MLQGQRLETPGIKQYLLKTFIVFSVPFWKYKFKIPSIFLGHLHVFLITELQIQG